MAKPRSDRWHIKLRAALWALTVAVLLAFAVPPASAEDPDPRIAELMVAVAQDEVGRTLELLARGVDADAAGPDGMTALMVAAAYGRAGPAGVLLSNGATVDLVDGEGRTALMVAARHDKSDMVTLLLEAGADATLRDRAGRDITVQVDPAIYPLRPVMILAPTTARIAALY